MYVQVHIIYDLYTGAKIRGFYMREQVMSFKTFKHMFNIKEPISYEYLYISRRSAHFTPFDALNFYFNFFIIFPYDRNNVKCVTDHESTGVTRRAQYARGLRYVGSKRVQLVEQRALSLPTLYPASCTPLGSLRYPPASHLSRPIRRWA